MVYPTSHVKLACVMVPDEDSTTFPPEIFGNVWQDTEKSAQEFITFYKQHHLK